MGPKDEAIGRRVGGEWYPSRVILWDREELGGGPGGGGGRGIPGFHWTGDVRDCAGVELSPIAPVDAARRDAGGRDAKTGAGC